ncbi:MAG: YwaF family protein [Clostridia bacterium]|nr:YwaF family protein [Clostridia bacterium]
MTFGSTSHIVLFLATVAFTVLTCLAIARLPKVWQTAMIVASVLVCCGAIFFRFAMNLSWTGKVDIVPLLLQQLQVCNFNFILLPLMLVPKLKVARQYAFYFSMFAASTTLVALNSRWDGAPWYSAMVFNSWLYHSMAIVCPLWMVCAGWFKPERKYVLPVSGCVWGYFTIVYVVCEILKANGLMAESQSFSYVYNANGIPVLSTLFKWIGVPYFYLYAVFPIVVAFFYALSAFFNRSVCFHANGGCGKLRKIYGAIGNQIVLPNGGFCKDGFTFVGWSLSPNSPTADYQPGATLTVPKRNVVLYAVWQQT